MGFFYNALIPEAADIPSQSQPKIKANFQYLSTMLGVDHSFPTNTGVADTGYHKIIHYVNQGGAYGDGAPASTPPYGKLYTKTATSSGGVAGEHLFYHQSTGQTNENEAALSLFPVRAAGAFDSSGAPIAGSTPFNCTCTPGLNARFTINITTTNTPSKFYIPFVSVLPASGETINCSINDGVTYASVMDPAFFSVKTYKANNNQPNANFLALFVIVFGG